MKLTNKVYHLRKAYDEIDGTYTPIETFDDFVDRVTTNIQRITEMSGMTVEYMSIMEDKAVVIFRK